MQMSIVPVTDVTSPIGNIRSDTELIIQNIGANTVTIGPDSALTTGNGILLPSGGVPFTIHYSWNSETQDTWYAVTASGVTSTLCVIYSSAVAAV